MIRSCAALASAMIVLSAVQASAQVASPAPQDAAPATLSLRSGTPVQLRMSQALTTEGKKLRVGERFQMEVAEAVTLNGQTIIPAGSPATGEVTDVRNKGMWGKSGGINARVLYVRVDGRQIRLSGQIDDKGVTGTAGVVGALVVIPVAGFFVTGTSAKIPAGAPVKAFIDEDVPIAFAQAQVPQAPLVVPAGSSQGTASATPTPVVVTASATIPQVGVSQRRLTPYQLGQLQGQAALATQAR